MSRTSVVKDNRRILNRVDRDKLTSGIVFRLDSEKNQGFRLDLFRLVDISPELEIKREPSSYIHACIAV